VSNLSFTADGQLAVDLPPLIDIPVPFIIELPPFGDFSDNVFESMAIAADDMGTFFVIDAKLISERLKKYSNWLAPSMAAEDIDKYADIIKNARCVELKDGPNVMQGVEKIKNINSGIIIIVRLVLGKESEERIVELASQGAEVLLLEADLHGDIAIGDEKVFIKDFFRKTHNRLVAANIRDRVTLLASGGISMAEHMAKIIINGADGVALGMPFLVAIECRMCRNCENGMECPVEMAKIDPEYGSARIKNLSAAWRNQLLEVLGAMGIREVRRLRGEFGRAMFREDLEREAFIKLFSKKVS